ncbi:collagen triple helix protein, partial [Cystoisospora suis]
EDESPGEANGSSEADVSDADHVSLTTSNPQSNLRSTAAAPSPPPPPPLPPPPPFRRVLPSPNLSTPSGTRGSGSSKNSLVARWLKNIGGTRGVSIHLRECDRRVGGFIHGLDVEEILFCLLDSLQQTPLNPQTHVKNTARTRMPLGTTSCLSPHSCKIPSECILADIRLPSSRIYSSPSFASFSSYSRIGYRIGSDELHPSSLPLYADTRQKGGRTQRDGLYYDGRGTKQGCREESFLERTDEDTVSETLWRYCQQHLGLVILSLRSFLEVRATSREHQISLFRVLLRALALWIFRKKLQEEAQVKTEQTVSPRGLKEGSPANSTAKEQRAKSFETPNVQGKAASESVKGPNQNKNNSTTLPSPRGNPSLVVSAWEREWIAFAFREFPLLKPLDERKICMALVVLIVGAIHPKYVFQKFVKELKRSSKAGLIRQFSELLHIFIGLFPPLSPRLLQLDQTVSFIHSLPFVLQSTSSYVLPSPAVFLPGTLSSSSSTSLFLLSALPPPPRPLPDRFATQCFPYDLLYGVDVSRKPSQEAEGGPSSAHRHPDPSAGERHNERIPSSVRVSFSFPPTQATPCSALSYLSLVHSVCSTIATTAGTLSLRFEQRLLSVALMGAAGVFSTLSSSTRTRNAAFRIPSPRLPRQSLLGQGRSGASGAFSTDIRKLEPEVTGLKEEGGEAGRGRGRFSPPQLRDGRRSTGIHIDLLAPSIFLELLVEPQTPDKKVVPPPAVSAPFLLKALYRYILPLVVLHLPHLSSKMVAGEDGENKGGGGRSERTKKKDGDAEDDEKKTKDRTLLSVFHQALFAGLHLLQLPPYFQRPVLGGSLGSSSPKDSHRLQESEGQGGQRGAEAQGDDDEEEEEETRIFSCFLHLVLLHLICIARGRSVFDATEKQKAAISHLLSKESFAALSAPGEKTEAANGLLADDGPTPSLDNTGSIDWRNGTDDRSEIKGEARPQTFLTKESGMKEEERGRGVESGGAERVEGGEMETETKEDAGESDSRVKGEETVGESERETKDVRGRSPQERKVEKEEKDSGEGREGIEKNGREQKKDRNGTRTAGRLFSRIVASALDEELGVYMNSVEGFDSPNSSSQGSSPEDDSVFQKKTVPDSAEIHLLLLLLLRWMSLITVNTKEEETRRDHHRRSESVAGTNKSSDEEGDQRDTRGASRAKERSSFPHFHKATDPRVAKRRENLRMVLQGQVYRIIGTCSIVLSLLHRKSGEGMRKRTDGASSHVHNASILSNPTLAARDPSPSSDRNTVASSSSAPSPSSLLLSSFLQPPFMLSPSEPLLLSSSPQMTTPLSPACIAPILSPLLTARMLPEDSSLVFSNLKSNPELTSLILSHSSQAKRADSTSSVHWPGSTRWSKDMDEVGGLPRRQHYGVGGGEDAEFRRAKLFKADILCKGEEEQGQFAKDDGGAAEVALGLIRVCCFLGRFGLTSSSTFAALIDLLRRAVSGSEGRKRTGGEGRKKNKEENEAFQVAVLVLLRHFADCLPVRPSSSSFRLTQALRLRVDDSAFSLHSRYPFPSKLRERRLHFQFGGGRLSKRHIVSPLCEVDTPRSVSTGCEDECLDGASETPHNRHVSGTSEGDSRLFSDAIQQSDKTNSSTSKQSTPTSRLRSSSSPPPSAPPRELEAQARGPRRSSLKTRNKSPVTPAVPPSFVSPWMSCFALNVAPTYLQDQRRHGGGGGGGEDEVVLLVRQLMCVVGVCTLQQASIRNGSLALALIQLSSSLANNLYFSSYKLLDLFSCPRPGRVDTSIKLSSALTLLAAQTGLEGSRGAAGQTSLSSIANRPLFPYYTSFQTSPALPQTIMSERRLPDSQENAELSFLMEDPFFTLGPYHGTCEEEGNNTSKRPSDESKSKRRLSRRFMDLHRVFLESVICMRVPWDSLFAPLGEDQKHSGDETPPSEDMTDSEEGDEGDYDDEEEHERRDKGGEALSYQSSRSPPREHHPRRSHYGGDWRGGREDQKQRSGSGESDEREKEIKKKNRSSILFDHKSRINRVHKGGEARRGMTKKQHDDDPESSLENAFASFGVALGVGLPNLLIAPMGEEEEETNQREVECRVNSLPTISLTRPPSTPCITNTYNPGGQPSSSTSLSTAPADSADDRGAIAPSLFPPASSSPSMSPATSPSYSSSSNFPSSSSSLLQPVSGSFRGSTSDMPHATSENESTRFNAHASGSPHSSSTASTSSLRPPAAGGGEPAKKGENPKDQYSHHSSSAMVVKRNWCGSPPIEVACILLFGLRVLALRKECEKKKEGTRGGEEEDAEEDKEEFFNETSLREAATELTEKDFCRRVPALLFPLLIDALGHPQVDRALPVILRGLTSLATSHIPPSSSPFDTVGERTRNREVSRVNSLASSVDGRPLQSVSSVEQSPLLVPLASPSVTCEPPSGQHSPSVASCPSPTDVKAENTKRQVISRTRMIASLYLLTDPVFLKKQTETLVWLFYYSASSPLENPHLSRLALTTLKTLRPLLLLPIHCSSIGPLSFFPATPSLCSRPASAPETKDLMSIDSACNSPPLSPGCPGPSLSLALSAPAMLPPPAASFNLPESNPTVVEKETGVADSSLPPLLPIASSFSLTSRYRSSHSFCSLTSLGATPGGSAEKKLADMIDIVTEHQVISVLLPQAEKKKKEELQERPFFILLKLRSYLLQTLSWTHAVTEQFLYHLQVYREVIRSIDFHLFSVRKAKYRKKPIDPGSEVFNTVLLYLLRACLTVSSALRMHASYSKAFRNQKESLSSDSSPRTGTKDNKLNKLSVEVLMKFSMHSFLYCSHMGKREEDSRRTSVCSYDRRGEYDMVTQRYLDELLVDHTATVDSSSSFLDLLPSSLPRLEILLTHLMAVCAREFSSCRLRSNIVKAFMGIGEDTSIKVSSSVTASGGTGEGRGGGRAAAALADGGGDGRRRSVQLRDARLRGSSRLLTRPPSSSPSSGLAYDEILKSLENEEGEIEEEDSGDQGGTGNSVGKESGENKSQHMKTCRIPPPGWVKVLHARQTRVVGKRGDGHHRHHYYRHYEDDEEETDRWSTERGGVSSSVEMALSPAQEYDGHLRSSKSQALMECLLFLSETHSFSVRLPYKPRGIYLSHESHRRSVRPLSQTHTQSSTEVLSESSLSPSDSRGATPRNTTPTGGSDEYASRENKIRTTRHYQEKDYEQILLDSSCSGTIKDIKKAWKTYLDFCIHQSHEEKLLLSDGHPSSSSLTPDVLWLSSSPACGWLQQQILHLSTVPFSSSSSPSSSSSCSSFPCLSTPITLDALKSAEHHFFQQYGRYLGEDFDEYVELDHLESRKRRTSANYDDNLLHEGGKQHSTTSVDYPGGGSEKGGVTSGIRSFSSFLLSNYIRSFLEDQTSWSGQQREGKATSKEFPFLGYQKSLVNEARETYQDLRTKQEASVEREKSALPSGSILSRLRADYPMNLDEDRQGKAAASFDQGRIPELPVDEETQFLLVIALCISIIGSRPTTYDAVISHLDVLEHKHQQEKEERERERGGSGNYSASGSSRRYSFSMSSFAFFGKTASSAECPVFPRERLRRLLVLCRGACAANAPYSCYSLEGAFLTSRTIFHLSQPEVQKLLQQGEQIGDLGGCRRGSVESTAFVEQRNLTGESETDRQTSDSVSPREDALEDGGSGKEGGKSAREDGAEVSTGWQGFTAAFWGGAGDARKKVGNGQVKEKKPSVSSVPSASARPVPAENDGRPTNDVSDLGVELNKGELTGSPTDDQEDDNTEKQLPGSSEVAPVEERELLMMLNERRRRRREEDEDDDAFLREEEELWGRGVASRSRYLDYVPLDNNKSNRSTQTNTSPAGLGRRERIRRFLLSHLDSLKESRSSLFLSDAQRSVLSNVLNTAVTRLEGPSSSASSSSSGHYQVDDVLTLPIFSAQELHSDIVKGLQLIEYQYKQLEEYPRDRDLQGNQYKQRQVRSSSKSRGNDRKGTEGLLGGQEREELFPATLIAEPVFEASSFSSLETASLSEQHDGDGGDNEEEEEEEIDRSSHSSSSAAGLLTRRTLRPSSTLLRQFTGRVEAADGRRGGRERSFLQSLPCDYAVKKKLKASLLSLVRCLLPLVSTLVVSKKSNSFLSNPISPTSRNKSTQRPLEEEEETAVIILTTLAALGASANAPHWRFLCSPLLNERTSANSSGTSSPLAELYQSMISPPLLGWQALCLPLSFVAEEEDDAQLESDLLVEEKAKGRSEMKQKDHVEADVVDKNQSDKVFDYSAERKDELKMIGEHTSPAVFKPSDLSDKTSPQPSMRAGAVSSWWLYKMEREGRYLFQKLSSYPNLLCRVAPLVDSYSRYLDFVLLSLIPYIAEPNGTCLPPKAVSLPPREAIAADDIWIRGAGGGRTRHLGCGPPSDPLLPLILLLRQRHHVAVRFAVDPSTGGVRPVHNFLLPVLRCMAFLLASVPSSSPGIVQGKTRTGGGGCDTPASPFPGVFAYHSSFSGHVGTERLRAGLASAEDVLFPVDGAVASLILLHILLLLKGL